MLPPSKEVIKHTEEFILIPKRIIILTQRAKSETFDNPVYKQKATQLSLFQRNLFQKPGKKVRWSSPDRTQHKY